MSKMIEMNDNDMYYYMNYLQKTYGDKVAHDFFMKTMAANDSQRRQPVEHTGISWVDKGVTNGSQWLHDKYNVVAEVVDENSQKGGIEFKFVQGPNYYSPDMVSKFGKVTSFSGFGKVIENSNAALEHGRWHCIKMGQPTTRAKRGYVAQVGDTLRRAYTKNGFKAS